MKGAHPRQADDRVELRKRRGVLGRRAERIAGREDMAAIDANAQSMSLLHAVEDRSQVLEPMTKRRSLPRRRLQPDLNLGPLGALERFVDGQNDLPQPLLLG